MKYESCPSAGNATIVALVNELLDRQLDKLRNENVRLKEQIAERRMMIKPPLAVEPVVKKPIVAARGVVDGNTKY